MQSSVCFMDSALGLVREISLTSLVWVTISRWECCLNSPYVLCFGNDSSLELVREFSLLGLSG